MMEETYRPVNESFARHLVWDIQRMLKSISYLKFPDNTKNRDTIFFIIDPKYMQPGFADRIRSIVNTYFIARRNGMKFKLYFRSPFDIERYYKPNLVDWKCELKDLDKSVFSSKLLTYKAEYPIPVLKKGRQYHYFWYVGEDLIRYYYTREEKIADKDTWMKQFKKCFDELFIPSEHLLKMAADTGLKERQYISVHFRFVNLLGNFEGKLRKHHVLPEKEQELLIKECLDRLKKISSQHPYMPIYVFSDSEKFLNRCTVAGYNRISGGPVGHIAHENKEEIADKTVLDFYIIGKSETVYSVRLHGMYKGAFSSYAAIIGGAKYCLITE